MTEAVADVLTRIARTTEKIGPLLLELLNDPDAAVRAARLREAGQHLGSLSAECLARAAEAERPHQIHFDRLIIDARTQP